MLLKHKREEEVANIVNDSPQNHYMSYIGNSLYGKTVEIYNPFYPILVKNINSISILLLPTTTIIVSELPDDNILTIIIHRLLANQMLIFTNIIPEI